MKERENKLNNFLKSTSQRFGYFITCIIKNWWVACILGLLLYIFFLFFPAPELEINALYISGEKISLYIVIISIVIIFLFTLGKPNIYSARYRDNLFTDKIYKNLLLAAAFLVIYILSEISMIKIFFYQFLKFKESDPEQKIANFIFLFAYISGIYFLINGSFLMMMKNYFHEKLSDADRNVSNILSDRSIKELNEDYLNYQDAAEELQELIWNCTPPVTIGIYGPWGSGKTSFMRITEFILKEELKNSILRKEKSESGSIPEDRENESKENEIKKNKSKDNSKLNTKEDEIKKFAIKTVWFDAWKYDKVEDVRVSFIDGILREMANDEEVSGNLRMKIKKLSKLVNLHGLGKKAVSHGISVLPPPFSAIGNFISENLKTYSNEGKTTETIRNFDKDFREVVENFVGDNGRLIVFIDDLDRCEQFKTLDIIESIKIFLNNEKCIFIIGADKEVIESALLRKHRGKMAAKYLDKIIQIEFPLPAIEDKQLPNFITSQKIDDKISKYAELICNVGKNPRTIKRVLNNIELQKKIIEDKLNHLSIAKLIKFNVIDSRWKECLWYIIPILEKEQKTARRKTTEVSFVKGDKLLDVLRDIRELTSEKKIIRGKNYVPKMPETIYSDDDFLLFLSDEGEALLEKDFILYKYLSSSMQSDINNGVSTDIEKKSRLATENFEKIIKSGNTNATDFFNLAKAYEKENKLLLAIENYTTAIDKKDNYYEAYLNRGQLHLKMNEIDKAIEDFKILESIQKENRNSYYYLAGAYDAKKDYENSVKNYKVVITKDSAANYSDYFNVAYAYFNKSDYDNAIEYFNITLEKNPKYSLAYNNRGVAYEKKLEFDKAIADYKKAIEHDSKFEIAYNNLRLAATKYKGYSKAISFFEELPKEKDNPSAYYYLGLIYQDNKQYDLAIENYDKAVEINKDFKEAYLSKAITLAQNKDYKSAFSICNDQIILYPKDPFALLSRGFIFRLNLEFDKAIQDFTKAVTIDPYYFDAFMYRGECYFRLKNYDKSFEDYSRASQIDPNSAYANLNIGKCYYQMGKYLEAKTVLSRAIEISSDEPTLYYERAYVNLRLNIVDEAKKDFTDFLKFEEKVKLRSNYIGKAGANAYLNNIEQATKNLEMAKKDEEEDLMCYNIACAYSIIFDQTSEPEFKSKSLEYLNKSLDKKETDKEYICREIDLKNLKNTSEFSEIFGKCPENVI